MKCLLGQIILPDKGITGYYKARLDVVLGGMILLFSHQDNTAILFGLLFRYYSNPKCEV